MPEIKNHIQYYLLSTMHIITALGQNESQCTNIMKQSYLTICFICNNGFVEVWLKKVIVEVAAFGFVVLH